MARPPARDDEITVVEKVLDTPESSLLDVVDHLLNKGVMATGDVTLGVAGVDLIYLRLSAMLCAADRIFPVVQPARRPSARRKAPPKRSRT